MKRFTLAATLALMTTPAFAQDTTALAQEYVNMPQVQQIIADMFTPDAMGNQVVASLPPNVTITDDQKSRIGTIMADAMKDLRPKMESLMVSGSAETFTADELQALIEFYGSEHGATIMSKMQPFMTDVLRQLSPEMQALQADVGPEIVEILQEKN